MSMQTSQEDLADLAKLSVKDAPIAERHEAGEGAESGWSSPLTTVDGMTSEDALQEAIRLHEAGGTSFQYDADSRLGQSYGVVQENCGTTSE
jgi:hypothetical protein